MLRLILITMMFAILGACASVPSESEKIPAPPTDVNIVTTTQIDEIEALTEKTQDRKTANFELVYDRAQSYLSSTQRSAIEKHIADTKIAILMVGSGPYPKVWESRASALEQYFLENKISVARLPFDESLLRRSAYVWLIDSAEEGDWRSLLDYYLVEPPEYYARSIN